MSPHPYVCILKDGLAHLLALFCICRCVVLRFLAPALFFWLFQGKRKKIEPEAAMGKGPTKAGAREKWRGRE